MLDTVDSQGNRLFVSRGTRMPGTRVGIHVHEYGGHTCVISGEITDFVEGQESSTFPAGTCYYMPPNTLMTAANLGTETAVLIDNFTLPIDAPVITILEPGWDEATGILNKWYSGEAQLSTDCQGPKESCATTPRPALGK